MTTSIADWPKQLQDELDRNQSNGRVGDKLLSETDRVRVWSITLKPGERIGFHKHVLDYFWTGVTSGKARSHYFGGDVVEVEYQAGETKHLKFGRGEFMMHDLQNIGDTDLIFTTVEFMDSANPPLPLGA
jgi:hypothetical protein